MKNFKQRDFKKRGFGGNRGGREERGGDKPVFFGKSRGGDRSTDREQRMFKAVCSDCRKTCEVPFKPSSDKPVFCRDCFSAKRDRETREYKAGLANGEVKKFGQDTLKHNTPITVEAAESTKKQLAEMNARIDMLTRMLEKMVAEKSDVEVVKVVAKTSVKKTTPKAVAKKAVAKTIAPKKVVAKVAVKKVVAKKVAPKVAPKKVATKKVVAKKPVAKKVAKKTK